MPLHHPQRTRLGEAISELIRRTYIDEDYHIEGDCNALIARAQSREYDEVARRFGFRDRHALLDEVRRRTSERWVWFNLNID